MTGTGRVRKLLLNRARSGMQPLSSCPCRSLGSPGMEASGSAQQGFEMLCRAHSVPACPQPGTALSSISTESCRTAVKQRSAGEQNAPKSQFRAFLYGHRLSPRQRLPAEVRAREAVSDWRLPSASSVLQVSFAAN